MEKDNGIPSVDRRASGREKRSQCKQGYPPHGFIVDRKKGFYKIHEVYNGKNQAAKSSQKAPNLAPFSSDPFSHELWIKVDRLATMVSSYD